MLVYHSIDQSIMCHIILKSLWPQRSITYSWMSSPLQWGHIGVFCCNQSIFEKLLTLSFKSLTVQNFLFSLQYKKNIDTNSRNFSPMLNICIPFKYVEYHVLLNIQALFPDCGLILQNINCACPISPSWI